MLTLTQLHANGDREEIELPPLAIAEVREDPQRPQAMVRLVDGREIAVADPSRNVRRRINRAQALAAVRTRERGGSIIRAPRPRKLKSFVSAAELEARAERERRRLARRAAQQGGSG